ncbi:hypothetical protein GTA08_BOTSDO03025 [Neofusicoccum parvum]|nr:hypothetical protein GTA08_BOTSDO03025 [Neofusicoccum parvum]
MPSERVQHAYGLIQKTLQQSGIIHSTASPQPGGPSNPYGYSNAPPQHSSWHQAGPPPPPPVPGYGPHAYGPGLGAPGFSGFQNAPPATHPIYRKYGHVVQDAASQPSQAFSQPQTPFFAPSQPQLQQWQQQPTHSPAPQQSAWPPPPPGPPPPTQQQQHPEVSPIQHVQNPYPVPHTPVNHPASVPPPHQLFSSPPATIPSVSPPPYNHTHPPPAPGGDYFHRRADGSATPQQASSSSYAYAAEQPDRKDDPPVSPLVSRQGSMASQRPGHERMDTVSSVSTAGMGTPGIGFEGGGGGYATASGTFGMGTSMFGPEIGVGGDGQNGVNVEIGQGGAGPGVESKTGASASALGFGGPGGWEYYTPLGEDEGEEELAEHARKDERKEEKKAGEYEAVSPVLPAVAELPSEPVVPAMKDREGEGRKEEEQDGEEQTIFELPAESWMEATRGNGKRA